MIAMIFLKRNQSNKHENNGNHGQKKRAFRNFKQALTFLLTMDSSEWPIGKPFSTHNPPITERIP